MKDKRTKVNSVIQIHPNVEVFGGCLAIVHELKEFGVQCYVPVPGKGFPVAYIRLKHEEFKYVGEPAWTMPDEEEEDE
jgi:hypothetical protein